MSQKKFQFIFSLKIVLTRISETSGERIASKVSFTSANRTVIYDAASGINATHARTRIDTFLIDTGSVGHTL